ncbi:MAG: BrxA family protein [Armatimonadota bacterium]|nr:BrxA family protein [Armatimonadota bacterium]
MSRAAGQALGSVRVGLHFAEAVAAAELAAAGCSRQEVVEQLAERVPAPDEERRRRIAATLARRVVCQRAADGQERSCPLPALIAAAGRTLDSRHLLLYATARREGLVMAVASEVFYRRFVLGRLPEGLSERDFATINTGKLLETDDIITHRLVDEYARRRWGLHDRSSTQCALRILREGGALGATWIARGETRCLGYFPSHRGPSWRVFVYALWEEFASRGRRTVARAHLRSMALGRVFCLRGPAVDVLAEQAADCGFCQIDGLRSGGPVAVRHDSFQEAVAALGEQYTFS